MKPYKLVICFLLLILLTSFGYARDEDRSPQVDTNSGGDATTLDTLDSTQFIRSDTTDSVTSGVTTWADGTTLSILGSLRLSDTDDSNTTLIKWNENDTSDRILNFLLSGGDRSLTLEADSYLNQDLTTDAHPTFDSLTISDTVYGGDIWLNSEVWVDVRSYDASGGYTATTGNITIAQTTLVVADSTSFEIGHGILVENAAVGPTDLVTTIANVVGNTITLADSAGATAVGQNVYHDDTDAIQAAVNATKGLGDQGTLYFPNGSYRISSAIDIDRGLRILGASRNGARIMQVGEDHLFHVSSDLPGMAGAAAHMEISHLALFSSSTTVDTAMVYLEKGCSRSHIHDLYMAGGYNGIWLDGQVGWSVHDITAGEGVYRSWAGSNFDASIPTMQNLIYMTENVSSASNANHIYDINSEAGVVYAVYMTQSGGEGNNYFDRIIAEGGVASYGIYVENCSGVGFSGLHVEGVNCGVHIRNSQLVSIVDSQTGFVNFDNVDNSFIRNSSGSYISIDEWSNLPTVRGFRYSGSANVLGINADVFGLENTSNSYQKVSGKSVYNPHNLVDGDLESWGDLGPIGLYSWGTGVSVTEENTIVKSGSAAAKVAVGGAGSSGALAYNVDLPKYNRAYSHNIRSADFQWTAGAGANDFYLEVSGGGDPSISFVPLNVIINDSWATYDSTVVDVTAGQWSYGDSDSLGFDTIYVNLAGNTDPDLEASGYIEYVNKTPSVTISAWVYSSAGTGSGRCYIVGYYNPGGSGNSNLFTIDEDTWTRVEATFPMKADKTSLTLLVGPSYFNAAMAGKDLIIDCVEVVEGDVSSPYWNNIAFTDLRAGKCFITWPQNTFTANDATPTVYEGSFFVTANSNPTIVTIFDNGYEGQQITVLINDNNTTVDFTGTNLVGNDGNDWSPASGNWLTAIFDGTNWYCDTNGVKTATDDYVWSQYYPHADGADNVGTMIDDHDSTNHRNYTRWSPGAASNDYDCVFQWRLPGNYASLTGLSLDVRASDFANASVVVTMEDGDGNIDAGISAADHSAGANDTWQTKTDTPTGSYAVDEWIYIYVKLEGDNGDTIDLSRVFMSYTISD